MQSQYILWSNSFFIHCLARLRIPLNFFSLSFTIRSSTFSTLSGTSTKINGKMVTFSMEWRRRHFNIDIFVFPFIYCNSFLSSPFFRLNEAKIKPKNVKIKMQTLQFVCKEKLFILCSVQFVFLYSLFSIFRHSPFSFDMTLITHRFFWVFGNFPACRYEFLSIPSFWLQKYIFNYYILSFKRNVVAVRKPYWHWLCQCSDTHKKRCNFFLVSFSRCSNGFVSNLKNILWLPWTLEIGNGEVGTP